MNRSNTFKGTTPKPVNIFEKNYEVHLIENKN